MPRAVEFASYGGPEVLDVVDLPLPEPVPGQVRVRVTAAGLNPYDSKVRSGTMSGGKPLKRPRRVGTDFAGVIDGFGGQSDLFTGGERVVGQAGGAAADFVLATAEKLVVLPDHVDDVTGAAIGVVGTTAVRTLGLVDLRPGQVLLLHAAAGGVGSFVTQLAVERGATVIGTASAANQDYLRQLGAEPVVYGDGWVERVRAVLDGPDGPDHVDAVIDAAGRGVVEGSLTLVRDGGSVVTIADFTAAGPNVHVSDGSEPGYEHALVDAVAAVARGAVTIRIATEYPLDRVRDAYADLDGGRSAGKIVLTVG